ncbi:transcriptional regulator [bacterium]|nr:transcriptional regulator [bacterium]
MKKNFKFSETLMHHLDNTAKISRVLGARYFDKHNEFDITYNNFLIIELLFTNPDIHQRNIARALLMGTANLSKELERMENKGLIKRKLTEKNKKMVKTVKLTKKGEEIYHTIVGDWEKFVTDLENIYAKEELKTFKEFLLRMKNKLTESIDMVIE